MELQELILDVIDMLFLFFNAIELVEVLLATDDNFDCDLCDAVQDLSCVVCI